MQGDGVQGVSFLDDAEVGDTAYLVDQSGPTSDINAEQFVLGDGLCTSTCRSLCPNDSTPSGLSNLPEGQWVLLLSLSLVTFVHIVWSLHTCTM